MTAEQMNSELIYHASLSPFKTLHHDGVITEADYSAIEALLRAKYSPMFIGKSYQISLDNEPDLR